MISERMVQLGTERSVIRELFEYGKARAQQVGAENVFDFSLGNPSVLPPEQVNAAAIRLLQENPGWIHGYTSAQGDARVRQCFAESLNRRFGTAYTPEEFYLTAGAAAALCCVFGALTCPGDEFLAIAPYFPEYRVFVEGAGAALRVVPADTEHFQINFTELERMIRENTKGVIVNSPNNPSGVVYSRQTLEQLARILERKSLQFGHPIYLISDEPYREIVFDGVQVPWIPSIYRDTVVCYSFSKSLSLPGERLGYVLVPKQVCGSSRLYAAVAGAGRSLGYVNAPSLFQFVIAQCCDLTADLRVYAENARMFQSALEEMGYRVVTPGGAFYLLVEAMDGDDPAFSEKAKEFDLLLVPGSGFGMPGFVRIACCVPRERIMASLPRFRALADSYR